MGPRRSVRRMFHDDHKDRASSRDTITRRDFVALTAAAGTTLFTISHAPAQQDQSNSTLPQRTTTSGRGLLYPQQNHLRNVLDISGIWQFQLDPQEEGETQRWFDGLPSPRLIPVPCSWNDLFDDAQNYFGVAWYRHEFCVPPGWSGQRVFLRIGSANAAKVWVNGAVVAEHLGGHLPFVAEVTRELVWDRPNVIALTVENKQLPDRVPPGPSSGDAGVFGTMAPFPATTYDFFPYSGLHRPVLLYSVPTEHIDDVTVITTIEGEDGVVNIKVATFGDYNGKGKATLNGLQADLSFRAGTAEATLRVPRARFWNPEDPHLYPLTLTLDDAQPSLKDSANMRIFR
jgi:beta-glucuronidase